MLPTATFPSTLNSPQIATNVLANSPVAFAMSLNAIDKHAVFMALLREAIEWNGENGLMPIEDESGEAFGRYVPPKAAAERVRQSVPDQSEADRERTQRAMASLGDTFEIQELVSEWKPAVESRD